MGHFRIMNASQNSIHKFESFSLYTNQLYMSYSFADSLRAE